jgi:AcrR family transcriptional regulator/DNA-binding MarR family transcriptional regulator
VLSRRGDVLVSAAQRSRIISSAVQVLDEYGYAGMSVARITGGAGVSRRTFYDLFEDREDCFLAAFEDAAAAARELVMEAWRDARGWREQTRGALLALLRFLDEQPGGRSLLIVDALKAGRRVQERRAELLAEIAKALHEEGSEARSGRALPTLTGEGVVGAVVGVIHTRLLARSPGPMVELLSPLMGMVVLPYLGAAAAHRELMRPAPAVQGPAPVDNGRWGHHTDRRAGLPMRVTHRTLLVLEVIGQQPGASNREVSVKAGVTDQGQISKLLARLEGFGLIENTSPGQPAGEPNRWRLTPRGHEMQQSTQNHADQRQRGR